MGLPESMHCTMHCSTVTNSRSKSNRARTKRHPLSLFGRLVYVPPPLKLHLVPKRRSLRAYPRITPRLPEAEFDATRDASTM